MILTNITNWLSTKSGMRRESVCYRKNNPRLPSYRADKVLLIGFFPNCATVVAPYITW